MWIQCKFTVGTLCASSNVAGQEGKGRSVPYLNRYTKGLRDLPEQIGCSLPSLPAAYY